MKRDTCFECKKELTQAGYDYQACECGWGPFGNPSTAAITKAKLAEVRAAEDKEYSEYIASRRNPPPMKQSALSAAIAFTQPEADQTALAPAKKVD